MPPPPKPAHLKKKNADPPKSREEENPSVNHVSETIIQQSSEIICKFGITAYVLALPVMEFQDQGLKIRKIFA